MKKTLLIISFTFFCFCIVSAQINKVPASSKPIEYKQPDGTLVTITLQGDENLHWAVTSDGYTILPNTKNGYEYAKIDKNKKLVLSGKLAHDADKRKRKEIRFLKKIQKGLEFSDEQIKNSKKQ
jgi:immune inhibitor A